MNHNANSVNDSLRWHSIRPSACEKFVVKASKDYEEARAARQEQIAMSGGHV